MYKGKDRRLHPRYRAHKLSLKVRRLQPADAPAATWDSVRPQDFNTLGLGFSSVHGYTEGEMLELRLSLDNIRLEQVIGCVQNVHGDRHGLQFDFSHDHMNTEQMLSALEQIEAKLNTSHGALAGGIRKMKRRERYSDKSG
ncbi:MAG: hypothetical protein A2V90_05050 [Gammaproteobacteria bacterium RBG_16_57_12]|nr:MAG: hypothetical protein A2V90_05050 [Gammaproteobacteria bacterium RBG_16_57_12]